MNITLNYSNGCGLQVKVTPQHNEEAKRLLSLMGVPFVEVGVCSIAPYIPISAPFLP